MTAPVPQTIGEKLLADINKAWRGSPTEFELARLRREAEKLMKQRPNAGHFCLGAIAAVEMDADTLRKEIAIARSILPEPGMLFNAGLALAKLGLYTEAAEAALEASEMQPENLTFLERAIEYHIICGQLSKAVELARAFRKRSPDRELPLKLDPERPQKALERAGLTEQHLIKAQEVAFNLLLERKVRHRVIAVGEDDDPESNAAELTIKVLTSVEKAHHLDLELSARLDAALPDVSPTQFYVAFEPVFEFEEKKRAQVAAGQAAQLFE